MAIKPTGTFLLEIIQIVARKNTIQTIATPPKGMQTLSQLYELWSRVLLDNAKHLPKTKEITDKTRRLEVRAAHVNAFWRVSSEARDRPGYIPLYPLR